jgi:hypothetical protein
MARVYKEIFQNPATSPALQAKKLMFWERIPVDTIPQDKGVVLAWQHENELKHAMQDGYSAIRCQQYYLDLETGSTWWRMYQQTPSDKDFPIHKGSNAKLLGGTACAWELTQHPSISYETVKLGHWYRGFEKVWLKTAAIAEAFWSAETNRPTTPTQRLQDRMLAVVRRLNTYHIPTLDFCFEVDPLVRFKKEDNTLRQACYNLRSASISDQQ